MPTDRIQRIGIIIGAMKAGTTAAFRALGQHREIALSREKEPNFFADEENFQKGMAEYEALWDWKEPQHKIALEASTRLTKEPDCSGAPARIASTGRDIRLIYLVRDPVQRIQSQYIMHAAKGWPLIPLSEGVDQTALSYSMYHLQISKYVEKLPRSKILVLTYEQLTQNTQNAMNQICNHFDLRPIEFKLPRANWTRSEYLRPLLVNTLTSHGVQVADTSRAGFGKWFGCLPRHVREFALGQIEAQILLTETHCRYIRARLAGEMRALSRNFGIEVSAWGFSS